MANTSHRIAFVAFLGAVLAGGFVPYSHGVVVGAWTRGPRAAADVAPGPATSEVAVVAGGCFWGRAGRVPAA